jgi:hypothetical protein
LLLGPLAGAAAVAGLYFSRADLRPLLPPPWDDLLRLPVLVGQGVFVAAGVLILVEWWTALRARRAVRGLTADDRDSWAGQARHQAVASFHPNPLARRRRDLLAAYHRRLGRQAGLRWLGYALLALTPALVGLALGLRELQGADAPRPFLNIFAPLVAGTAEGVLLWLLGTGARRSTRRLLDDWVRCCSKLEAPLARPAGSRPATAVAGPAGRPVTAVAGPAEPAEPTPPAEPGAAPEESPPIRFE